MNFRDLPLITRINTNFLAIFVLIRVISGLLSSAKVQIDYINFQNMPTFACFF